jgi:hypothetical protein
VNASRGACAALAAVLIALAFTVLRPHGSAGGTLRDFQAYRAAGATWLDGKDPYSASIASHEPSLPAGAMLPFVGVPAALPWWALLARLRTSSAALLWQALLIGALGALVYAAATLAGARTPFDYGCIALTALAFAPVTGAVALGQTAVVAAALAALCICTRRAPAFAAGAFAAFALQPNVALGTLAALRRRAAAAAFVVALAAIYACGAVASGPLWPITYARALIAHQWAERGSALQFTPASIALGFGASQGLATATAVVLGCLVAFVAIATTLRARNERIGFGALCCALPFVCGFFHEQDLAALFVPAIIALRATAPAPRAAALPAIVATGANWLDVAQSSGAIVQDLVLGCALIAASLAVMPRFESRVAIWTCAALALLAGGVWLAATHPLPVWPDAMHRFVLGANASVAQAWRAQLANAGLLAHHPASAALRTIALGGCALFLTLLATGTTLNVDVHEVVERRNAVGLEVL